MGTMTTPDPSYDWRRNGEHLTADPSCTDLDVPGEHLVVWLCGAGLGLAGHDGDLSPDAERLELAFERSVVGLCDISDGRHCSYS